MENMTQIVLASTSPYRRELLAKLSLPFSQLDPEYAEQTIDADQPRDKAIRLARGKAKAGQEKLGTSQPAIIIGSDQVAECQGRVLSKPGSFIRAKEQLLFSAGEWVTFNTGVALVDQDGNELDSFVDSYSLKFRRLSETAIEHYLNLEEPYDCAGSIKAESHGVLLFEQSRGADINTLYGLPLIRLTSSFIELNLLPSFK